SPRRVGPEHARDLGLRAEVDCTEASESAALFRPAERRIWPLLISPLPSPSISQPRVPVVAALGPLVGGVRPVHADSLLSSLQSGVHHYIVAAPGLTRQNKAVGSIQRIERVLRSHYHGPGQQPGLALTAHAGAAIVGKRYP